MSISYLLVVLGLLRSVTGREQQGLPDAIESIDPIRGAAQVPQQTRVFIDLQIGYEATMIIDGVELPTVALDDIGKVPPGLGEGGGGGLPHQPLALEGFPEPVGDQGRAAVPRRAGDADPAGDGPVLAPFHHQRKGSPRLGRHADAGDTIERHEPCVGHGPGGKTLADRRVHQAGQGFGVARLGTAEPQARGLEGGERGRVHNHVENLARKY